MKRGESTNTIAMIILLASFALRLSYAMPLLNLVGENATNGGNNLSISLPEIITSNYTSTVFANREAWRANNCEGNFNCAPVSPMQCGSTSVIYFSPTEDSRFSFYGCQLNFTVTVDNGTVTEGAELALFKKRELGPFDYLYYYVFISYKPQNASNYQRVLTQRAIDWNCNSWQVFNISDIKEYLPSGLHKINLLVTVFKETDPTLDNVPILSCTEIRSTFVINTSADMDKFINGESQQQESETTVESATLQEESSEKGLQQGDGKGGKNASNEGGAKKEEGSGMEAEEIIIEPTTKIVSAETFVPALSLFVSGGSNFFLSKRSIDVNNDINSADSLNFDEDKDTVDSGSGVSCEREVYKVTLPEDILDPRTVDKGKCSNSTENVACLPSKFLRLDVLQLKGDLITIKSKQNFIITECKPYPLSTESDKLTTIV